MSDTNFDDAIVTVVDGQGNLSSLPEGEYIDHTDGVYIGSAFTYADKDSGEPSLDLILWAITNKRNKYPLFMHICPFDPLNGHSVITYILQMVDDEIVFKLYWRKTGIKKDTIWDQLSPTLSKEAKESLRRNKYENFKNIPRRSDERTII